MTHPAALIDATAEAPCAETLDILRQLIAFDTTSRNSNLALIEWVRDRLQRQGVFSRLTYDADGRKANLFATVGGGTAPGLVLSGHTDVVPVDGQAWNTDPFRAEVADGPAPRLYGRGACDMKGFIACVLAAVPAMRDADGRAPFHIALTYDEEVGCLGVGSLLADLADRGIRPAACIVGEPTDMQLVVAHKGRREMRCCVRGREAHSSLPEAGVNAIEYGARIIAQVQAMALQEAAHGARDPGFDVPYTSMLCSTVQGGIASNTVPRDCEFRVEKRFLPQHAPDRMFDALRRFVDAEVVPEMQRRWPAAGVDFTLVNETPGFEIDAGDPLVELVRRLTRSQRLSKVAYSTEAGLFQRSGIPTVVCGPGNIEQAHKPNEFIKLAQLSACERFLRQLIDAQAAAPVGSGTEGG